MASEIRVNSLSSRTGLSTVTFTDTGPIFSGITTFQDNSGFNVGTGGSIFSPASNTVTLGTNNAERLRIDSAGRMLLGTTTEGESNADTLTIAESGNAGITIRSGSSATGSIYFSDATSGGGEYDGWIAYNQNSRYFQFGTAQTEALRITSDGKMGLGISSPNHKLTLFQSGTSTFDAINFVTGNTNSSGYQMGINSSGEVFHWNTTNSSINFATNNTERVRIDPSGHLLHGVTADEDTSGNGGLRFINSGDIQIDGDQKALVFRSTNNTAQLQSAIEWWNENGAGVQSKIACDRTAVSQAPSDLVFYTSSNVDLGGAGNDGAITERVRITSSGNVGINSTNPSAPLEIYTAASAAWKFRINTTVSDGAGFYQRANGDFEMVLRDASNNVNYIAGTSGALQFTTSGSERLRITSSGKLGVDSTSPFSKIQAGTHTFSGGNGMHTNDRVGMSNHGNLTGLMLASTYNDSSHPEYGLVFVQGPNTSSYNVWSVSPDGPAKGNSLNLHYGAQNANIHAPSNRKFEFTGDGYLLKPNHPSFRVGRHTDYNHTAGQPVQFNTTSGVAHLNQGNHYSTTNHRFVAPVAGVYQFSACVIVNGIANNTDLTDLFYLYKNGTNMAYSMRRGRYVVNTTGTSGYYVDFMSNVNVLMAVNDYCDIICRFSLSIHGNSAYTWFSGTLVG